MKGILLALFLFPALVFGQTYYVTTSGSGTTCSQASPCSITYAFANAVAGDTWYIKAGNYGALQLSVANSGSVGNPIRFIGYTTTPGDIEAISGPTYDYADLTADGFDLPDNIMPHLELNPVNNNPNGETAITISSKEYIEIKNFFISEYDVGIEITGFSSDNITLDNIIGNQFGNWDSTNPCWNESFQTCSQNTDFASGYGILTAWNEPNRSSWVETPTDATRYDNHVWKNCMIVDAGLAVFFPIDANNLTMENCVGVSRRSGNGADYIFDFYGIQNSTITNCLANRVYKRDAIGGSMANAQGHFSRGFILQAGCSGNVIDGFTSYNVNNQIEASSFNTIKNVTDIGDTDSNALNDGRIQIIASNNNTIINYYKTGGGPAVSFLNNPNLDRQAETGFFTSYNNYIINMVASNPGSFNGSVIHTDLNGLTSVPPNTEANYFINCTFNNMEQLLWDTFPSVFDITNVIVANSTNGTKVLGSGGSTLNIRNTVDYNNAYAAIGGTNPQTGDPLFTNVSAGDFTLRSDLSSAYQTGTDASVISINASTDIDGNLRTVLYDVGAYERSTPGVPPNPGGEPSVVSNNRRSVGMLTNN